MEMHDVASLMKMAYDAHVLEEDDLKAIGLLRGVIDADAANFRAHVLLGIILADQEDAVDKKDARKHFGQAIELASEITALATSWPEEAVIYHLGLWEWKNGSTQSASLFFLIDYLLSRNKESYNHLLSIIADTESLSSLADIKLLLKLVGHRAAVKI